MRWHNFNPSIQTSSEISSTLPRTLLPFTFFTDLVCLLLFRKDCISTIHHKGKMVVLLMIAYNLSVKTYELKLNKLHESGNT